MDKENFGKLKMGMDSVSIIKILGRPDSTSKEIFWGADGGMHSDWHYNKEGVIIGINRVMEHPQEK